MKTGRSCVGYATYHAKTQTSNFRYQMKDVDCDTKAPFICQYNPGEINFSEIVKIKLDLLH